jgi:hypothetical protein
MRRDRTELRKASLAIAASCMAELKAKRILKIDVDHIRCAIAGWMANDEMPMDALEREQFEEQTLRQLINLVG